MILQLGTQKKRIKYIKLALSMLMILMVSLFMLAGCNTGDKAESEKDKPDVVCTTFPQYDWVREIAGDKLDTINLTLLQDNGADLHSYQPTAEDIIKINESDLFIYVGGESDDWVDDVLEQGGEKKPVAMNLVAVLGDMVKQEVVKEGMDHHHDHDADEHDHDHDHDADEHHHDHDADHHHEEEVDEHVWLSLRNAEEICEHIAEELGRLDVENAEAYKANAEAYIGKLEALDKKYERVASKVKNPTVVFADRFPFRYLMDDYGIDYYAAFSGCSAETEASFETVAFLAKKVDELKLGDVVVIDKSNEKIAKTVILNTEKKNQNVLCMNSMQTVTAKDIADGANYLDIMTKNLEILKQAI